MTQPCPFWIARTPAATPIPLTADAECDVAIVGGGVAGLTAALMLQDHHRDVLVLEGRVCGGGATGRSSGFITPDSELQLYQIIRRFGPHDADMLYTAARNAVAHIRQSITRFSIACDQLDADCFWVANAPRQAATIEQEHDARRSLGFKSRLYGREDIPQILGTSRYHAGVRYGGTFAVDGFQYCQGLRHALLRRGGRVHEESPALEVAPHSVRTARGTVRARHVLVCLDRFAEPLGLAAPDVYHAQTFLMLSEPLDPALLRQIFPDGPLMVWDTDLVYQYFRATADSRLLVGGGLLRHTYSAHQAREAATALQHMNRYIHTTLPALRGAAFPHWWPGLIGVSKDLLPIAGRSPRHESLYYAMCAAGIPWAVLAALTAARQILGGSSEVDRFLVPGRAFSPVEALAPLLPKRALFAASHYYTKEFSVGDPQRIARQRTATRAVVLSALAAGAVLAMAGVRRRAKPAATPPAATPAPPAEPAIR